MIVLAIIFLSGCASTSFQVYEGRNNVFQGEGGTRTSIAGIDFWEHGDPPRKCELLGIITDDRPGGMVPMSRLKADIAKKAKEVGGDAVVLLSSGSNIRGYAVNTSAYSYGTTGTAVPITRNKASFAVLKYLD